VEGTVVGGCIGICCSGAGDLLVGLWGSGLGPLDFIVEEEGTSSEVGSGFAGPLAPKNDATAVDEGRSSREAGSMSVLEGKSVAKLGSSAGMMGFSDAFTWDGSSLVVYAGMVNGDILLYWSICFLRDIEWAELGRAPLADIWSSSRRGITPLMAVLENGPA
jgi:hypothetical protein